MLLIFPQIKFTIHAKVYVTTKIAKNVKLVEEKPNTYENKVNTIEWTRNVS